MTIRTTHAVFNELENNFNDSQDDKSIKRVLKIYGVMMVKVNHRLMTHQFLTSSIKGKLALKLPILLPFLVDIATQQEEENIVKEIVQLLTTSYLDSFNKLTYPWT